MTDVRDRTAPIPTSRRPGVIARMRMWWDATCEIAELTRDRDREDRIIADGAAQIAMTPGGIWLLFRHTPRNRSTPTTD
jgi:hypothetical protein